MNNPQKTRHGKRAPGIGFLGVPMPFELKNKVAVLAAKNGQTSAGWARHKIKGIVARMEGTK